MNADAKFPALCLLEWNRGGHHDTHLRLYVESLLRAGRKVAVLCPEPGALEATGRMFPGRLAAGRMPELVFRHERKRWANWLRARSHAREVGEALLKLEERLGAPCTLAFFACLYERDLKLVRPVLDGLRRPWVAMYLQAVSFHGPASPERVPFLEFMRRPPDCRGLLMLDEAAADRVREHTGRPVVVAPDFADESTGTGHPLGKRYRDFAGRRPLVASLGHLQPSKGCLTLVDIALRTEVDDLAFLFAGGVVWSVFDAAQRERFQRAIAEAPNAVFHTERVPDERAYNSLVQASDVLFAAYVDFPHSSNTLTKAAVFEKPIIVSDGHLMAARVREFRLGEVVPAGDADAALRAIREITADPAGWRGRMRPRWAEYRERHSLARLDEALGELLRGA